MSLWTHRRRRRLLEFLGGCPVLPLRARRLPQDPSMRFLILLHVLVAQLLVELQANGGKAPERIDKPPWTSQAMPPNGCVFKRFSPLSSQPYWYGQLPDGQTSPGGRHSRKLTWGFFTQRSEAETESVILQWLHDNAQTG